MWKRNKNFFNLLIAFFLFLLTINSFSESVKIRYLTWETSLEQIALVKKLVAKFEELNPDVKIQLEATSDATRIFLTDAAAGAPPDVMYITTEYLAQLVDKKVVLPIDEYIKRDKVDMGMFVPETIKGLTFNNNLYGYPIHFSADAIFYNKQIFDRFKVPYPDENWTWETFKKYAAKMTNRDENGRVEIYGTVMPDIMFLIGGFGGKIFNEDGTKCIAYSKESIEAINFALGLIGKEAPTSSQAMDTSDMQLFANGKLAMFHGRTWQIPQIIRTMKNVSWDVAPIPIGKIRYTFVAVGGNCIARNSKHKEAAWRFVKFYSSMEGQGLLGCQKNCTPALKELANSEKYFLCPPPDNIKVFIDAANNANKLIPDEPWNTEFTSRIWNPLIEKMRSQPDVYTPEKTLKEIEKVTNQFLLNYKYEQQIMGEINPEANTTSFLIKLMFSLILIGFISILFIARTNRQYWEGYLFISPWLIGFILFALGPTIASLYLSFCRYDLLSSPKWTGLDNLINLFRDPLFLRSLWNTFFYSIFTVPLSLIFSLLLAMMLNIKMKGVYTLRAIYYLPALTSGVAISLLWRWIFNPQLGLFNSFLKIFGIKGPDWLTSPDWALPAIIIMSVWCSLGGPMLIYLAGLQNIPQHLYEAAEIDGANKWRKFWNVTFPMLSPAIFFNLIMAIIGSFQVFTTVFVMTSNTGANIEPGGPANATMVYVLNLYQTGFRYLAMGKACAMAWILFMIILGLTLLNQYISKRWVHYDQV